MIDDKIHGLVNVNTKVRAGQNYEGKAVIEFKFEELDDGNVHTTTVVTDRAAAARLINQLRKVLDA